MRSIRIAQHAYTCTLHESPTNTACHCTSDLLHKSFHKLARHDQTHACTCLEPRLEQSANKTSALRLLFSLLNKTSDRNIAPPVSFTQRKENGLLPWDLLQTLFQVITPHITKSRVCFAVVIFKVSCFSLDWSGFFCIFLNVIYQAAPCLLHIVNGINVFQKCWCWSLFEIDSAHWKLLRWVLAAAENILNSGWVAGRVICDAQCVCSNWLCCGPDPLMRWLQKFII